MRPHPWVLLVLLGALGVSLGYCVLRQQSSAATGAGVVEFRNGIPQGHVYTGIADEPDNVNLYVAHGGTVRRYVFGFTHEGLLDTDPTTGALRPALASEYSLSPDGTSCTFTLREGVRFADGSPVTMDDVLFGWEIAKAGHLAFGLVGEAFGRVAAATALDARHLQLTFKEASFGVLRAVGEAWLVGKRQFFVDRVAALAKRLEQPVPAVDTAAFAELLHQVRWECGPGTGPFELPSDANGPTTWRRRQDLLLRCNPHHWRREQVPGTWNLGGVRLLFRQPGTGSNDLFAGAIDWFADPNGAKLLADRPDLQQDYRNLVYDHPAQGPLTMLWNCRRKPLDDVRVRRALARLFDSAAMLALYAGQALPAKALAKSTAPEYPTQLEPFAFDPAQARRELREAVVGADTGTPLRLTVLMPQGDVQVSSVLKLFCAAAKEIGVEVLPRELEYSVFVALRARDDWDGQLVTRGLRASADPYDYVHSQGADNDGHWVSAEADRLAVAARRELDEPRRAEILRTLHELVYREQPLAILVQPLTSMLFNRHIQNAVPGPRGLWPEKFWVAPEHQRR